MLQTFLRMGYICYPKNPAKYLYWIGLIFCNSFHPTTTNTSLRAFCNIFYHTFRFLSRAFVKLFSFLKKLLDSLKTLWYNSKQGGGRMARTKQLNIVVTYSNTSLVINDKGRDTSPRFELYDTATKEVKAKSNNPMDFDEIVRKKG